MTDLISRQSMEDKAVLLSIQPKYCELIANREKTIEVRKTRPNIDPPFKCYIYCTKEHNADDTLWIFGKKARDLYGATVDIAHLCGAKDVSGAYKGNGKVVGEFICDNIFRAVRTGYMGSGMCPTYNIGPNLAAACLTYDELENYGKGRPLFGWHISELKIYDRPKELSEFRQPCRNEWWCESCAMYGEQRGCGNAALMIKKAPQSWCYVEELI